MAPLKIWSNAILSDEGRERLVAATANHQLEHGDVAPEEAISLAGFDIAFGQPPVDACAQASSLRWLAVNTAGITHYDTPEFREDFRQRGSVFTNMSSVFSDSCAQHLLAMMLALSRKLPASWADQQKPSPHWAYNDLRDISDLLTGKTVLILSFGRIARRLVELLQPFGMKIYALRRKAYSEKGVHVIAEEQLSAVLPQVDHLVNILPHNASTDYYVNARRLALLKRGARFYNIGRGCTVDQNALMDALREGRVGEAYLDVTEPEPLPPEHPLWRTPNCHITSHTGGGHRHTERDLLDHFLSNLAAFERNDLPGMRDRID
ncbi:MAG: D-2-hydroxyacid dehydrogenase [Synoicihabitans sp.]